MRVWITNEQWPASEQVLADAAAAGCDTIWHGIPASRVEDIPAGTVGAFELADPVVPAPSADPLHQLAAAIVAATTLDDVKPAAQAILADGDAP